VKGPVCRKTSITFRLPHIFLLILDVPSFLSHIFGFHLPVFTHLILFITDQLVLLVILTRFLFTLTLRASSQDEVQSKY